MTGATRPLRIPADVPLTRFDPPEARAGERGTWAIDFELPETISAEAPLKLMLYGGRHVKGTFENIELEAADSAGKSLTVATVENGVASFTVARELSAGERVRVVLKAEAPVHALADKFVYLFLPEEEDSQKVPATNREKGRRILSAATVDVVGGPLERLRAYGPSRVEPGQAFSILVRPEDRHGNVSSQVPGPLRLHLAGEEIRHQSVRTVWGECVRLGGLVVSAPGVARLAVRDESSGLCAESNPIDVGATQADEHQPFWGMIHGHTELSDGAGTIDHYFTYARDACALDFCAPGDHDHLWETSDEMFQMMLDAVKRYHEDGRFVVFPGYEWAKWRKNGDGDRCVYYLRDEQAEFFHSDDGHQDTPPKLFDALRGRHALVIPHHTAEGGNPCDFKDHWPEGERLVEIYSRWGNSERAAAEENPYPVPHEVPDGFVQRALAMGWRVGFTAGGDDHLGHPGDEIRSSLGYKAGLLGVWAKENTRQGIWEALMARRCWGATGPRIIVRFHVNDAPMGSECSAAAQPEIADSRRIKVEIHGAAAIEKAEIVRNNKTIHAVSGDADLNFGFEDTDPLENVLLPPAKFSPEPFAFYYLRVTQADGEMAWASPVWVQKG